MFSEMLTLDSHGRSKFSHHGQHVHNLSAERILSGFNFVRFQRLVQHVEQLLPGTFQQPDQITIFRAERLAVRKHSGHALTALLAGERMSW